MGKHKGHLRGVTHEPPDTLRGIVQPDKDKKKT
jgi:hypothetical protein